MYVDKCAYACIDKLSCTSKQHLLLTGAGSSNFFQSLPFITYANNLLDQNYILPEYGFPFRQCRKLNFCLNKCDFLKWTVEIFRETHRKVSWPLRLRSTIRASWLIKKLLRSTIGHYAPLPREMGFHDFPSNSIFQRHFPQRNGPHWQFISSISIETFSSFLFWLWLLWSSNELQKNIVFWTRNSRLQPLSDAIMLTIFKYLFSETVVSYLNHAYLD